jgi:gas vesicle protein
MDCVGSAQKMSWIMHQIENFNLLTIIVMVSFVTILSKSNNQKMLKEQSKEIYNDIEELKDEIRGNTQSIINSLPKK